VISHYEFGSITIDGKRYDHDVIIFKGEVRSWWRKAGHDVAVADIESLVKEGVRTIVFGTGASGVMKVDRETESYLKHHGISIFMMKTGDAVGKFNQISADPNTAAALHLTC